jgi:hypothetical protein
MSRRGHGAGGTRIQPVSRPKGDEPESKQTPAVASTIPARLVRARVVGNVWAHKVGDILELERWDAERLVANGAVEII